MKKNLWVLIILLSCSIEGFAQNKSDEHVTGHVVNKTTQEYIPSIAVSIKGTTIGTVTDATGHYFIKNLKAGKYILVVSGIGYKTIEKDIDLISVKSLEMNFEMEEDQIMLESVVVSANRNETNRREAPTIVNIISPKNFENTNSVCLAQALDFVPGLRCEDNCENCGLTQVRMDGLAGEYSQILIDSRSIFSSLASVYGLEQLPANMIDRVEVVRGGGSAIFGSNAIGGTINIITKDPTSNSVTLENNTTMIYGITPDINTFLNATVVSDDSKAGVTIFGSKRQRSPFDYLGDGYSELPELDGTTVGFKAFYKTSNYSKLTLEYFNLYEYRRGGDDFNLPLDQTDLTEEAEQYTNTGSLNYDIFSKNSKHHFDVYSSAQLIHRTNYAGAYHDTAAFGLTNGKTLVAGAQYTYTIDKLLFMPSVLTAGTEFNIENLYDDILGYDMITNQTVNTKSVFLQNEWKNKKLSILIGCRFDKHSLISNPIFSPRANLRYALTDNINLRASYSSGFRAPQIYDEDLHGSEIGGQRVVIVLNPNLKTETSQSYTGSVDFNKIFGAVQTDLLVEGFYTDLNHVFVLDEVGADSTKGIFYLERDNAPGAVVKGINIEFKIVPAKKLQFQCGMTFQSSEYKVAQQWSTDTVSNLPLIRKMFRAPNQYGYLTASYKFAKHFNFSMTGTYTGTMFVQHYGGGDIPDDEQVWTPSFFDLGIKLTYDFKLGKGTKIQFNGGVKNIFNNYQKDFDHGANRDAAYIYGPQLPRSITFGLKIMI